MRQGQQHRRGRGRHNNNNNNNSNNHRKGQNPLTRSFESNGPDVKVRGTPAHIAEKYISLARDAQSSGDPVLAENYLQHAEHYNRIIIAYREQTVAQGGESGGSNPSQSRFRSNMDPVDADDYGDDDGAPVVEDFGQSEQPTVTRFPNEPMSQGEGGPAARQPSQTDGNGHQQHGGQYGGQQHGGNRQHRNEQYGRYRDRNDRSDRNDRYDRPQYQDRQDRQGGDRDHRQDRYGNDRNDRYQDRQQRYGDRRERYQNNNQQQPSYQPQQHDRGGGNGDQPSMPERAMDVRQQPAHSPPPSMPAEAGIQAMAPPPAPPPPVDRPVDDTGAASAGHAAPSPAKAETGQPTSRRRERFGTPGNDQPEFLKRPVRRKREPEASAPSDAAPAMTPEPPQE